jgi:hypothetical protein
LAKVGAESDLIDIVTIVDNEKTGVWRKATQVFSIEHEVQ